MIKPDADASSVDRGMMMLANNLEQIGWPGEADELRSSAAYLRETWRGYAGDTPSQLFDALETIRDAADAAMSIIDTTTPPP